MRGLAYRICLTVLNLLFPPFAVMILCGAASWDTILNCCLFLLAILPSHIHGFYLTCTYFHRRKKVNFPQDAHYHLQQSLTILLRAGEERSISGQSQTDGLFQHHHQRRSEQCGG